MFLALVLVSAAGCASVRQEPGAKAIPSSPVAASAAVSSVPVSSAAVSSGAATSTLGSPDSAPLPDSDPFRVAAPILDAAAGPGPAPYQPPCQAHDIRATAQTRAIASGVAGVIQLVGNHCSLHIFPGPTALLDNSGQQLTLPVEPDHTLVNPAANQRPDLPLGAGVAAWGFTWRGSWCGPAAVAVVVALGDDPAYLADPANPAVRASGEVVAPLTGPAPPCDGHSDAVFVPGVAGEPTDATLTSPPEWAGLRATLIIAATIASRTLPPAVVELLNTTATPIAMSPCPNYALTIESSVMGGTEVDGGGGSLPCALTPRLVPAHGTISYDLAGRGYDPGGPGDGAIEGTVVTIQFAIAGVPTATATPRVSRPHA